MEQFGGLYKKELTAKSYFGFLCCEALSESEASLHHTKADLVHLHVQRYASLNDGLQLHQPFFFKCCQYTVYNAHYHSYIKTLTNSLLLPR